MLTGGKILAGGLLGTLAMVFGYVVLSTVVVEITRQQLPWGKDKVREWMLGTPQPAARELEDNGYVNAGAGVGWEGYVHPYDVSSPSGLPFDFTPRLNCYFQDPDYPRHTGVDFPEGEGTPVYATMAGRVVWADPNGPWGNLVVVENNGYQTWFAHLQDFAVSGGDVISRGQRVGSVGNNGNSTGFHLHYGIKLQTAEGSAIWVNPLRYFTGADYTKVPCR